jgi:hypothetical protein|tara:strand:+ start:555 stop:896 length:342 start_codon:yes stop_codon:yes gene_type:complete
MSNYINMKRTRTITSEFGQDQEVTETMKVYSPPSLNQRELDIMLVLSYTWSQIGEAVRFTFPKQEVVYRFAADFVDNHQLTSDEYGIGEGKEMDWDEHVENFMLEKLQLIGML